MAKKIQKWTIEEEKALLDGIKKYGLGKWSLIIKDSQFGFYLTTRSNIDLKDKYRTLGGSRLRSNIKNKVSTHRRNCLMHTPLDSSKKRSKIKLLKELNDSEDYHNQCTITPQRKGTRSNTVNRTRKLNSEKVHNLMHQSSLSSEVVSESQLFEVLSDSEDYQISCTGTRQRRGTRRNMINNTRKLNCNQVHNYLESLWLGFPEDKKSAFAHLDPLWYTLYSDNSKKERVLKWMKNKEVFSRKYVVFPIVQWGHWSVLIFCHFGETLGSKVKTPCILLLDSLEKTDHSKQLEPIIRKLVLDIYKSLDMTEDIKMLRKMPFLVPKVPQQRDSEECGFFVLYYIKLFVENAPEIFSISNGYPYFMKKDWFDSEELDSFCKTLNL